MRKPDQLTIWRQYRPNRKRQLQALLVVLGVVDATVPEEVTKQDRSRGKNEI